MTQVPSEANIAILQREWEADQEQGTGNKEGLKLSVDLVRWRVDHLSDFPEWEDASTLDPTDNKVIYMGVGFRNEDVRIPDGVMELLLYGIIPFLDFEIFLTRLIQSWDTETFQQNHRKTS